MSRFPTFGTVYTGKNETNSYTHTITMPAGIVAGNYVLVMFASDGLVSISTYSSTGTWEGVQIHSCVSLTTTTYIGTCLVDGQMALTLETDTQQMSTHASVIIQNLNQYNIEVGDDKIYSIGTDDSGTNAVIADSVAQWGEQDYLTVVFGAWDGILTASAAPTNFTGFVTETAVSSENVSIAVAYRQYRFSGTHIIDNFTSASGHYHTYSYQLYPIMFHEVRNLIVP